MHRFSLLEAAVVAGCAAVLGGVAQAAGGAEDTQNFSARLTGFQEVPAILTDGTGTFALELDKKSQTATYTLTYSSGFTSTVTQAHIHFGKVHVAGGIEVFLCTNLNNGPAGTPACPPAPATVTGTLSAASVVAITTQNVNAGDFDALTDALNSNAAYANIHTVNFPAGEIRGQVRQRSDSDDRR